MNSPSPEVAERPPETGETLLSVRDLTVRFRSGGDKVRAVNGVSFEVRAGETVAIVGESGSGKSVTSLSILRLLPGRNAEIGGSVRLMGEELTTASEARMRQIRGDEISMIFQEPMTSLDPVMTVGRQIAEAIEVHQGLGREEAFQAAIAALDDVRVPEPARRARQYPFQLSGGLRQRVMIAMAMSCRPKVLIADEPTTALDVTIQAQILNLMDELREKTGAAVILITHDLGVVAEMADRVAVMYAGRVVEQATAEDLFARPRHPYTLGLLGSVPKLGSSLEGGVARLQEIKGVVPSLRQDIVGCAFAPRCPFATERCRCEAPPLETRAPGHLSACWEAARLEAGHA
jgi:peptide/nickel transport system ATP-binding protein